MKDLLHEDETTLVIHFGDNVVGQMEGLFDVGPFETLDEWEKENKETVEESKHSKWESEANSNYRFWEILFKWFIEKKHIDLSKPEIKELFRVPEDHWWKQRYDKKDKEFFIDGIPTWKDFVKLIRFGAVWHEG